VGLKLNGTHQLLAYIDDVNLLGINTDTIKTTLVDASEEVGLEINVEETKYMLLGQNRGIKIANRSFESVYSSTIWRQQQIKI
jgi:hypothetical protein